MVNYFRVFGTTEEVFRRDAEFVCANSYEQLEAENKSLKDKVNEQAPKIVAYESMHERAVKDIQEYSKALEILAHKMEDCSDDSCKHGRVVVAEECIECVLAQAKKEISNG